MTIDEIVGNTRIATTTATIQTGHIMDAEQGMVEATATTTIEDTTAGPLITVDTIGTTMITTVTIVAMVTAAEATIVVAEEAYTLAV